MTDFLKSLWQGPETAREPGEQLVDTIVTGAVGSKSVVQALEKAIRRDAQIEKLQSLRSARVYVRHRGRATTIIVQTATGERRYEVRRA